MSSEAVLKLYPKATALGDERLGATLVRSPLVSRQKLTEQKVPGLAKATTVELRYWKNQLWVVIVYFGDNSLDEVTAYLKKTYGAPRSEIQGRSYWSGEKTEVSLSGPEKWFSLADRTLSNEARQAFADDMRKQIESKAGGAATPAPTPAQ